MKYLFLAVVLAALLWLLDFYVYRNWRSFARHRGRHLQTLTRIYWILLFLMPLTLPAYLYLFRWWEVEPKVVRALFVGFWAVYYLPKLPIAVVLALKDVARLISWQFAWLASFKTEAEERPSAVDEKYGGAPDLTELRGITRGEFLRRMGWTAASVPFVVVGYGVFRTLYDFEVRNQTVALTHLPRALDGIRIVQVSDLHAGSFFSLQPVRETVDVINNLRPDLIMFTGDFVNHDADEMNDSLPALAALQADIGAFACLGNHDHYARVEQVALRVAQTPFQLLVNQHAALDLGDSRLYVIGTDNTGFNQHYADLPRATTGIPERSAEDLRILLAHDPSFWDQARSQRPDIDLTLSGHTHGGQLGFEMGPLRWSLAKMVYPRWAGLYAEPRDGSAGPGYLYVNRGLGTVGPPIRIGIRPEITVVTLVRGDSTT